MFLQQFENLKAAISSAFERSAETDKPIDRLVFFLSRLCVEDFFETLLLAGNGYGVAALKVVRGMYERIVSVRYLAAHPDGEENFADYHFVQQHKLLNAIKKTFGEPVLSRAQEEEVERNYDRVRDRFMVTDCRKCGTKRLNHTWSKLDFVSMASQAGEIGKLIIPGYYLPLLQTHPSMSSMFARLDISETGGLVFKGEAQRKHASDALITAHNIVLNVLELQRDYFHLESLDVPLQRCLQDFMDIWGKATAG